MSGGGGGMGGAGSGTKKTGYGVTVNKSAFSKGIAAAPAKSASASGLGGSQGQGRALEARAVEAVAKPVPTSKGPSGVDTGGAGTDPISRLMATARSRRSRMARGGGLSNVRFGEATLG